MALPNELLVLMFARVRLRGIIDLRLTTRVLYDMLAECQSLALAKELATPFVTHVDGMQVSSNLYKGPHVVTCHHELALYRSTITVNVSPYRCVFDAIAKSGNSWLTAKYKITTAVNQSLWAFDYLLHCLQSCVSTNTCNLRIQGSALFIHMNQYIESLVVQLVSNNQVVDINLREFMTPAILAACGKATALRFMRFGESGRITNDHWIQYLASPGAKTIEFACQYGGSRFLLQGGPDKTTRSLIHLVSPWMGCDIHSWAYEATMPRIAEWHKTHSGPLLQQMRDMKLNLATTVIDPRIESVQTTQTHLIDICILHKIQIIKNVGIAYRFERPDAIRPERDHIVYHGTTFAVVRQAVVDGVIFPMHGATYASCDFMTAQNERFAIPERCHGATVQWVIEATLDDIKPHERAGNDALANRLGVDNASEVVRKEPIHIVAIWAVVIVDAVRQCEYEDSEEEDSEEEDSEEEDSEE